MRKILRLKVEEIESIGFSKKGRRLVYDENIMEFEPSVFQDLGKFLRTMRMEEDDISFKLHKHNSNF